MKNIITNMRHFRHLKLFEDYEYDNDYIIAYHGSPYDFDYFTSNSIGSGEGVTGWGYGLYFSDDFESAEEYARKLEKEENEGVIYKVKLPPINRFLLLNTDLDEQCDFVIDKLKNINNDIKIKILTNDFNFLEFKSKIDDNINDYDFDKGDDEYNEFLQDILDAEFMNIGNNFFDLLEEFLPTDISVNNEYMASSFLNELGVVGNVHNGFGDVNYVVFDDENIEIIEKIKR